MTDTENPSRTTGTPVDRASATSADRAALGLAAVALFVAAVNLRPAIAAVSPLVDTIRADLGLSATGASLLTTIPTLAMGLCAPLAAVVARRRGLHGGVTIGLLIVGVGTLARVLGNATWLQLLCAFAVGAGIAITQTLLPAVVKSRFSARPGLVTGLYTAGLGLGGAVAAGATAPLADAFGSWPVALGSWAVLAVAGIALWSVAKNSLNLGDASGVRRFTTVGLPWRSSTAWLVTAVSAGNSALYYCELAWIAPLLTNDGGRTESSAGVLLTVMISIQVVAMIAVPALLGERRDQRAGLAVTTVLTAAGFLGFALAPDSTAVVWLSIVLIGIGHGGLFPLVLTLPVTAARDAAEAGRISGMAFFVGYGCAAAGPLLVGLLRDATGNFELAFVLLAVVTAVLVVPILALSPHKLEE
ncbi:CynX/NimT family MFS transporter [Actinokineospora terrae]|uniref:MFS transporter, CP family, cyanate transporter n=1 Tax=Actinokineospora terrae TaxID=155974 RepID=A0A1H9WID1_9PSEU|nr:MFS transporter [Actinokineospora terrae]SES33702.1 MFS transporter, CP family, cyanate transporter [Actinokineospora terrae]